MGGTRWLHADAETKSDKPERVVVSFGPEHAPIETKQVALALDCDFIRNPVHFEHVQAVISHQQRAIHEFMVIPGNIREFI